MAEHNSSEEVDLGVILNRMKNGYHSFLIWMYGILRFLIKNLIFISILVVIGLVTGYFLNKSKDHDKETTLIVQINFKGGNYIYDAIQQLNKKIVEKDIEFLDKIGLVQGENLVIKSIEISPIVNITEFLKNTTVNDRNVDLFLQQAQYEDQILTSEIFIAEYKTHKIELTTSYLGDDNALDNLLKYLNDNKLLQDSKAIIIKNTEFQIRENQLTVAYVDSIIKQKGSAESAQASTSQVYVNTRDGGNDQLHFLLQEKRDIMEEIQNMQIELLKYDNPVVILNKPALQIKKSFTSSSIFFYPIFFLVIFFIISIIISLYRKAKILSEQRV